MSTIYELKQFWWCRHCWWWEPWQWPLVQGLKDPHTLAHDKNCQRQQFEAVVQCPACYTGGHTFRNDAVCQLFAIVIGPVQSHEVDELSWVIFIMITPTLTGFLSLMASTCEVKVGMKADARWQSIFKCEHCEGSALASFQWKSRWMETDYQSSTVTSTRAFNGFFFGANCHNSSSLVPNSDGEKKSMLNPELLSRASIQYLTFHLSCLQKLHKYSQVQYCNDWAFNSRASPYNRWPPATMGGSHRA